MCDAYSYKNEMMLSYLNHPMGRSVTMIGCDQWNVLLHSIVEFNEGVLFVIHSK